MADTINKRPYIDYLLGEQVQKLDEILIGSSVVDELLYVLKELSLIDNRRDMDTIGLRLGGRIMYIAPIYAAGTR